MSLNQESGTAEASGKGRSPLDTLDNSARASSSTSNMSTASTEPISDPGHLNGEENPRPRKRRALHSVESSIIPKEFAQVGSKFSETKEPEELRSYVGKIVHVGGPNKFYVTTNPDARRLRPMQNKLTAFYDQLVRNGQSIKPLPELLKPGLLVVCLIEEGDWLRARIIRTRPSVNCEHGLFEVFFVDYGRLDSVKLTSIHYLHSKHLQSPCALKCRLGFQEGASTRRQFGSKIFVLPSGLKNDRWGIKTVAKFYELITPNSEISVKFYAKIDSSEKPVWAVQLKTYVRGKLVCDFRRVNVLEEIKYCEKRIPIQDLFIGPPYSYEDSDGENSDGEADAPSTEQSTETETGEAVDADEEREVPTERPSVALGDNCEQETTDSSDVTWVGSAETSDTSDENLNLSVETSDSTDF